jgi:ParB-like chromosome segregation protein Spo0J
MKTRFKTPFKDLMPPPSQEEVRLLNADIAANGVHNPILVSADGEILAGHRRYEADSDAPVVVVEESKDWSIAQKRAFVLKENTLRRNLDANGRRDLLQKQKLVARELKDEGKKQKEIASALGVSQQTVSEWLQPIHTASGMNSLPKHQATTSEVKEAKERLAAGETQSQVAKDMGLSQPTVSRIAAGQTVGKPADNKPAITAEAPSTATTDKATTVTTDLRARKQKALDEVHALKDQWTDRELETLGKWVEQQLKARRRGSK